MKHRSPIAVALLSFITLYVYGIYWATSVRNELVQKGYTIPANWILWLTYILYLGLSIGMLVVMVVVGLSQNEPGLAFFLFIMSAISLGFILFGILLYWFYYFCRAVSGFTDGKVSVGLSFTLFIVAGYASVPFIWEAYIQDAINKRIAAHHITDSANSPQS